MITVKIDDFKLHGLDGHNAGLVVYAIKLLQDNHWPLLTDLKIKEGTKETAVIVGHESIVPVLRYANIRSVYAKEGLYVDVYEFHGGLWAVDLMRYVGYLQDNQGNKFFSRADDRVRLQLPDDVAKWGIIKD